MAHKDPGVLFISLHTNRNYWYIEEKLDPPMSPPLGILSMAAYLKQMGYRNIRFVDFGIDKISERRFASMLKEMDPVLVGITVYAETHAQALTLSRAIKSMLPSVRIILGNAQATFTAEELLRDPNIDFVCLGEGEVTIFELLEALLDGEGKDFSAIAGLAWKRGEEIVINPWRERILRLDALPFPDRTLIEDKEGYADTFTLITGRGCPAKCTFCCSRAFWGAGCTLRSPENIFAEVEHLYEQGWQHRSIIRKGWFFILDDHFTMNPKRVHEFCDLMERSGIKLFWHCATRLDVLESDLMRHMYRAGCRHLQIGVESAVQEISNAINKNLDLATLETKLREATGIGLEVSAGFIIGFPEDTKETIRYNVDYALRIWNQYNLSNIGLAFLVPFPGTPIYEKADELGLKWKSKSWSQLSLFRPNVYTDKFSEEDLVNAYNDFVHFARARHERLQKEMSIKIREARGIGKT